MPTTPTQRTLDALKEMGFIRQNVEKFNFRTKRRQDLFGCIDIIAAKDGVGIIGIQATGGSGGNHAARRTKACAIPELREWLLSGGRFEIWSWAKQGPRGKRKTWTLRREELKAEDIV